MSDPSDKSKPEDNPSLDLSQLQGLNFGPDWSDAARSADARGKAKPAKGGGGKRPTRDRRPERPPRKRDFEPSGGGGGPRRDGGPRGDGGQRGERRQGGPRRGDRHPPQPFKPVVDVSFYPEDTPFKALCHAMRGNCRTYELFEIARLILDKPDRFVVVLHPKKDEGPQEFFISAPDGLAFLSEDQAVSHVLKHHLDHFVETEEIEVEPPKGNFPAVNKCGITGELLGPPNYHRYQALLVEHHAINVPNMPFEKFQQRIESVRDEEIVQQWVEKMRKEKRYKLKQPDEEFPFFDNLESVKFYLTSKRRNEVVRTTQQARFSGEQAEKLPRGALRDSIFGWREQQQRFPLETANNLRGRLRRMHFTIYKRGSKGASYVCAVKRKFRNPQTRLAESLQELIDFIEKHANINVSELPEQFLGIDMKKAKAPEPAVEKAPDIEAVPEEEANKIVEKHEQKRAAKQDEAEDATTEDAPAKTESPASEAKTEEAAAKPEEAVEPKPEEAAEAKPPEAEGKPVETEPTSEAPTENANEPAKSEPEKAAPKPEHLDDPQLRQLMFDLRWLVTEGYVTEYGDGRLFAAPPMDETQRKEDDSRPDSAKAKSETTTEPASSAASSAEEPSKTEVETKESAAAESIQTEPTEESSPPPPSSEKTEEAETKPASQH